MVRAVVTGCNKGIGYYIAQQLVAEGIQVIAACRNHELGIAAAAELGAEFQPLDLADPDSIDHFVGIIRTQYGSLDILVNNGAIAFKAKDPTPFQGQTAPTLNINYWGTARLTDGLLPLMRETAQANGSTPRIMNVASMAGRLGQVSSELQQCFSSDTLTREELNGLMKSFEDSVQDGTHRSKGFSNSNYGMSKLGVIAYTMMLAREEPTLKVNCCCPGYCDTDMSSHSGPRHARDGARNATILCLSSDNDTPSGVFIRDEAPAPW